MPARLLPPDKLTHAWIGFFITLPCLPLGWEVALAVCLLAAVGRELYGWWRRGWRMHREDLREAALDIAFTMAGGFLAATAFTMGSKA
jgi:hypothetical protein